MRRGSLVIALLGLLVAVPSAAGQSDPRSGDLWGMRMIEAPGAHATTTGAGATVAVIDTGAHFGHPDLQGRLIAGHDYVDDDDDPQDVSGGDGGLLEEDGAGHGTHVSGTVVANANNGIGVFGVAPGARVLAIRVLDTRGEGEYADVIAGIDEAVAKGADIINLSLGGGAPPEAFDQAIDRALDRGVIVVAAAGNESLPACDQPSGQGRLLCVAAVDERRMHSFYSNFSGALGISAPGGSALGIDRDIVSTWWNGGYEELAGTSQATPHVSGVAALLVSLGVRGQAAVQRILATADDAGTPGPDQVYGAGIVNARRAVAGLGSGGGGAGGGAGGPLAGGAGAAARISLARVLSIRAALRRGIRVTCLASGRGRCAVRAYVGRRLIAAGSRALEAGRRVTVTARVTRAGRRILLSALRRRRTVRATVRVSLPGVLPLRRSLRLRP